MPSQASNVDQGHRPHNGAPDRASRVCGTIRRELIVVPTIASVNELVWSSSRMDAAAVTNTAATAVQ